MADFNPWLDQLVKEYCCLSSEEKTATLDKLISCSEANQLKHLSHVLPRLLYRDFLSLLPPEVAYHILKYLSVQSLLTCSSVSRTWNTIIRGEARVWWEMAAHTGVADIAYYGTTKAANKYKTLCVEVMKRLAACERGGCFQESLLQGHNNRVMAVCYVNGRVATGSDDQSVRVWDAHSGKCLYHISTHSVCHICLTPRHVYTASFDGSAACWELSTGEMKQHFVGHTSAVFSIDVNDSNLVITGSSDKSIKIWSKDPSLLTTIEDEHTDWVTKVKFLSLSIPCANYIFASVDKYVCHIWETDIKGTCRKIASTKKLKHVQITSFFHGTAGLFNLCMWREKELCNNLSTYTFSQNGLSLVSSTSLKGDVPLRCQLLGAGQRFAALTSSSDISKVFVYSLNQNRCVARIDVPSCRSTRNGSTLSLGDHAWLDGFDGTAPEGTVMVACLQNSTQVLLLNWHN